MAKVERAQIKRQIKLPINEAIKISFRNVRMRLGRSVITLGGTFFGIAFLSSILANESILTVMKVSDSTIKAKQIWLLVMSLLVSSLGIINAMLMAVIERYREIGTMKCLGALDGFIVELFLLESAFLGLLGSLAGSIVGILIMVLSHLTRFKLALLTNLPVIELVQYIFFSTCLGTVISILCAVYPAYRAAKMDPAIAMRVEI